MLFSIEKYSDTDQWCNIFCEMLFLIYFKV